MGNLESRQHRSVPRAHASARGGFTLVDVLVSLAVVAVLIGLLFPSLSSVGETAKRVICQSNLRQVGMTLAMYADHNNDRIPASIFLPSAGSRARTEMENMVTLRLDNAAKGIGGSAWDGLGVLFEKEYLSAPKLFYCPSHKGEHPFRRYSTQFDIQRAGEIVGNYHYRGLGPNSSIELHGIKPESAAIVADGMRIRSDYNHRTGFNVLRANLAVQWVKDIENQISDMLPTDVGVSAPSTTEQIWKLLDE